jgi:hypothetical protein
MKSGAALAAWVLAAAAMLAACDRDHRSNTAVLGSNGPDVARSGPATPPLTDGHGQPIPPVPAPAGRPFEAVRTGDDAAQAVWIMDDHVVASGWTRTGGWSPPQPLERIYGESSAPRIVSNGHGAAMAVWHHRVGNIHSLRFSRFDDATGWSLPDVLPGALPRPQSVGAPPGQDAPQLQMDAAGNVVAHWSSGFRANEVQSARYVVGQGWSAAASEPVASAFPAGAASGR